MKQPVCINLDWDLIQKIDSQRGNVPRSRVVEKILTDAYREPKKTLGSDA
jgi:hypothetical protein